MGKVCIFGTGGFAKEVYAMMGGFGSHVPPNDMYCGPAYYEVEAFLDLKDSSEMIDGKPILKESYFNSDYHRAIIAIASPKIREKIVHSLSGKVSFPIVMRGTNITGAIPSVLDNLSEKFYDDKIIGKGSIICYNSVLTHNILIGSFAHLNLATTIGHGTIIGDYFTSAPGVHISGDNYIGDRVFFGTNACTIEKVSICSDAVVGAGACVVKDITEPGVYVGAPARKIK